MTICKICNWSSFEQTKTGVGVGRFQAKIPLTNFQSLAHQISLLASVDTLISFFLYKTQKQTIPSHSCQFTLYYFFALIGTYFP